MVKGVSVDMSPSQSSLHKYSPQKAKVFKITNHQSDDLYDCLFFIQSLFCQRLTYLVSEREVFGLTRIFTPLSTCHSVVVYAHSVDA